ncbi:hypothetical protein ACI78V_18600 [Geodermatophilus sp. SYSU D00742]
MEPKKVTVVVDREGRCHADFWTPLLEQLTRDKQFETEVRRLSLADWLAVSQNDAGPTPWQVIESSTDILIINWDAVNGDPDFGGDTALRWFEHRQSAMRRWLNDGGLLIIDGQAVEGVPHDRYYAAVVGEGEVRLSEREDPTNPDRERNRMRGGCRMTRLGRGAPGFEGLDDVTPRQNLRFEELYPSGAVGRLVPRYLNEIDTSKLLYRGWFRRRLPSRTLRWTSYVRRDKHWPRNFPTLLAAKYGKDRGKEKGIVFASTMMLAATHQVPLIRGMLCAHGHVPELPEPGAFRRGVERYAPKLAAGLLSGILLYYLAAEEGLGKVALSVVVGLAVTVVLDLLPWIGRSAHRLVRAFTGA